MSPTEAKRAADELIAAANAKAKVKLDAEKEAAGIQRQNSLKRIAAAKECKVPAEADGGLPCDRRQSVRSIRESLRCRNAGTEIQRRMRHDRNGATMSGQKRQKRESWQVRSIRELNAHALCKSKQELILLRAGEEQLLGPRFAGKAEK